MMDAAAIRRAAQNLRATARSFEADLGAFSERFSDYRDEVRAEKVAVERARMEALARKDARLAVEAARAAIEAQRYAATGARQAAESRVDHARVDRLRAELAAQIALGVSEPSVSASGVVEGDMLGDPRLRLVRDALDRARETRDADLAHAVRLAGAEVVGQAASGRPAEASTMQARQLARDLNAAVEMGVAESPAVAELGAMESAFQDLTGEVREAERVIAGDQFSVFSPVTPWAAEVLGETVEDHGGGVVWKSRSEQSEQPAPSEEAEAA